MIGWALNLVYLGLLAVFSPLLVFRAFWQGKYRQGWGEKFLGRCAVRTTSGPAIWLHAVSVGEVLILRTILPKLREAVPGCEIWISSTTHTGHAVACEKYPDCQVIYFPLDFTGELKHTLEAAQAGYRGERARVWATTLDEQLAVVEGYFQLLETRRLRTVTEQTIAVYRTQVGIAQARYDQERLTKNDLLTVQVALQTAEQSLLARDLAIEQARWGFNQVIGVAVNEPARLADVTTPPGIPTVEDALAQTYEHNPILLSLLEEQQRLENTAIALERSRLPRFGAGGGMDYSTSDILTPTQIGSGFAGFTWDLGTDTRREAQISEARILADKNRLATQRQLRDLEAAVRAAQLATAERLAAYATAQRALGQAEENLRIREQQFDVGRAQSDDVLIAERLLAEQRATLATALYQAHTRRAALQRLMGLPIDDLVAGGRG